MTHLPREAYPAPLQGVKATESLERQIAPEQSPKVACPAERVSAWTGWEKGLAPQPGGILVRAALPGTMRIGKKDLARKPLGQRLVLGHLFAPIVRQGFAQCGRSVPASSPRSGGSERTPRARNPGVCGGVEADEFWRLFGPERCRPDTVGPL